MLKSVLLWCVGFAAAWQPAVKTGLDVLVANNFSALNGKKILILTNPTGVTQDLYPNVDVMQDSGAVNLVGVAGPEHGFRGTAQAGSGSGGTFIDPQTGLTVYDAYNANETALVSFIKDSGADTVIFDIQDVGARFYTYTWAMYDTFVASTLCGTDFIVLDRPNPLTGLNAYGPILNESYSSYVGRRPIAQSHGMTSGELAQMFKGEGWITDTANTYSNLSVSEADLSNPKLDIIQMEGWTRGMAWRDTGLKFVPPSPNIPTTTTASIYPGTCLFEGTSISEGRGSTTPFELLGAGFGNTSWTNTMRSLGLPHSWYRDACFTPTFSKWEGNTTCGLQVYMDFIEGPDYDSATYGTFDPVYLGTALVKTAYDLYHTGGNKTGFYWLPNGDKYDIDVLAGGPLIREGIEAGMSAEAIRNSWSGDLEWWKSHVRAKYLIYN